VFGLQTLAHEVRQGRVVFGYQNSHKRDLNYSENFS
jgi:hypothetical protein